MKINKNDRLAKKNGGHKIELNKSAYYLGFITKFFGFITVISKLFYALVKLIDLINK